ncbi:MAG: response regulator transcription factor [Lachnospiraceae bacterium]|nr:response regulator transcription factor [Lachnospiraceae bacterium]
MDFIHDKRILIVDDDEGIRNMIRVILGKEQFGCLSVAETGTDAVRSCREWQPDLVILDIMLPDLDGYEVCRRIREFSMCPVLFLSAKSEETDRIISYTIGGDDYITEPFSPKELVAHINAILRRQSYYEDRSDTASAYSFGRFTLDFDRRELLRGQAAVPLTAREYLLLEYLVRNRNVTLSREQIVRSGGTAIMTGTTTRSPSICATCGKKWSLTLPTPSG